MTVKNRSLAAVLAMAMVLTLLPVTALAAEEPARLPDEPAAVEVPEAPPAEDIPEPETVTLDPEEAGPAQPAPAALAVTAGDALPAGDVPVLLAAAEDGEGGSGIPAIKLDLTLEDQPVGSLYFTTSGTEAVLADAEDLTGAIKVPERFEHNGVTYRVTEVGPSALANQTGMTQIWLPNNLSEIGSWAFAGCDHLKAVGSYTEGGEADPYALPDALLEIHQETFYGCTRLSNVKIGPNVTDIWHWAFAYCYSLGQNYTDANGVTYGVYFDLGSRLRYIHQGAFQKCIVLENITLPNTLEYIGPNAFQECTAIMERNGKEEYVGLKNLVLPDSVKTIGEKAFMYCFTLDTLSIPATVETIEDKAFYSCSHLKNLEFRGEGSKDIAMGTMVFYWCRSLENIQLPGNLKVLPAWTFAYAAVEHPNVAVTLPQGMERVGQYAFNESGISSITFSDTVSSVGILAFGDCHNLREIHWPNRPDDAPLSLGMMAFTDCENLTEVTLPRLLYLPITEQDFGGDNVFYDCDNLRKVTVEEGASFIPERCFRDCDALQTVTLPASLETIHEQAFYSCPSLTDIDLSTATGLKTIGELAFCRAAMSSVSLPASVESIGREAFSINQNLTGFTVAANSAGGYYAADGVLYQTAGNETHLVCYPAGHAGADFAVPGGVTHIDRGACSFAEALVTVTFPDTLKAIDHYAFSHCVNLKTAQIGAGVTQGSGIFDGCYHLTSLTIPENTTVIGGDGYFPTSLSKATTLTIPASVTTMYAGSMSIGSVRAVGSSFQDLPLLESIEVDPNNQNFISVDGVVFTKDMTTLIAYPPAKAGESYTIPSTVTTIAAQAFMNVSNLKQVTVHSQVETVGHSAFYAPLERVDFYRDFTQITPHFANLTGYNKMFNSELATPVQVYVQGDPTDPAGAQFIDDFTKSGAKEANIHIDLIAPVEKAGDRFLEGGVIYTLTDATHVKVGANPNYQGSQVTVPATVTHGGVTYTVTGVEAGAFAAAANLTKASVLLSANEIGANAFDSKVAVTTRDTMADFTLNTRYLAYGDTLVVSAPAAVAEGAAVTLTGAQGSVTASVKGGTAVFPVDKDFYHAVDSKGVGVPVTLTGGGVTTEVQLIVSPKTYTSDDVPWYNPSVHSYHISKPYDGTTAIDVVTAEPLAGFTEKGDDLAIRFYNGNTRYAEAAPLINESFYGELELVGADKDYYAIDPTLAREAATYFKVHVSYGQLYIKEVDGVLQKPVFRRVWNVNDGLRVRDCGPGGGQFVAYFPTVDDAGKITGYDTVDVGGYFRYTDDNPYPAFQDAGDFPVQMEGVYHWEFVPTGNGEWQSKLDNFRFSGAFKPWDTSLVPSETGDTGETGENPPLPGYVTDSQPDQPALPSGGDTAVQPTPPTDDKQPDEKPDDKPTTGGGSTGGSTGGSSTGGSSTGGGSTGGATTGGGTVTSPGAATVTASAVSQAVKAASQDAPVVLKADKDTVKLTAQNLKTIAGHGAGVTVETPTGALTLDGKALAQVQGTGKADATLSLEKVAAADLTKAQTDALKGVPVYDLAVTAGGKTVTGFDDGGVQVSIPWDAAAGDLIACQVAEDGALTPVPTSALVDGRMVFQTDRLCQYALVENTAQFRDAQAHWARSDVSFAAGRGIVVGVGGGDFHPDSPATVEAVVTVLGRLAGVADTDDAAHWSQPHMAWAEDAGILPDGLDATAPITREQLAYLLARYMDQTGDGEAAAYADLDQIDAQYLASVRQVRQLGLMQGRQDNTFDPQGSLTRGELAAVLHRLILVRLQQDG